MSTSQLESGADPDADVIETPANDVCETDLPDSGEDACDETVPAEPAGGGTRRWIVRTCAALIVVIAIVSSVLAAIFGWKLHQRDDVDAAAQHALSTAKSYAVTLTSIDSQHIDADYAHVLDGATGDFKTMYTQSSAQLKTMLVENKARSVGKVVDASVQSASRDQVVVMLFVDQEITNSVSPDPRVDRSRILLTMQRVGGRWMAGKVEMA